MFSGLPTQENMTKHWQEIIPKALSIRHEAIGFNHKTNLAKFVEIYIRWSSMGMWGNAYTRLKYHLFTFTDVVILVFIISYKTPRSRR